MKNNPVIFTLEMLPAEVAETQHGIAVLQSSSWAFLALCPAMKHSYGSNLRWHESPLPPAFPVLLMLRMKEMPGLYPSWIAGVCSPRSLRLSSDELALLSRFGLISPITLWGFPWGVPSWRHQQKMLEPSARLQGKCSRSLSLGYPPVMLIVCLGKVNV